MKHTKSLPVSLFASFILLLVMCGSASAATYYVRASGNDANSGTSPASAFRTVAKAALVALAGERVYVGAGVYTGKVTCAKDGTSSAPIQFIADTAGTYTADQGQVILNGGTGVAVEIKDDHYVSFAGFNVTGLIGIHIENSTGSVIQGCSVYNTSSYGVYSKNSYGGKIAQNIFTNTGGSSIYVDGGSLDVTNCLINNPDQNGIHTHDLDAASSVWHTTIYSAGLNAIFHDGGTLSVYNSILSHSGNKGMIRIMGSLTHNYNILYQNFTGNFMGTTQSANEWLVDPKYTSLSDFHPQSSSPAIDQGTSSTIAVDIENNVRPSGAKPDLGCYEGSGSGDGGTGAIVYYVRLTGNDANNGRTPATAFRTIRKAALVAQAGNKVYIGGGNYLESIVVAYSGTPSNPIEFIGDPTGAFTGDAGTIVIGGGNSSAFHVDGKDYISILNMQFGGVGSSPGTGTTVDITTDTAVAVAHWQYAKGGVITNCHFKNGKDAIRIKGAEVVISDSTVEDYATNGIYVEEATSKLTLRKSYVYNCNEMGIVIKRAAAVLIEESIIFNNGNSGIRTESDQAAHTFVIRRSEITDNRDGFHIHGKSAVTIENCLIAFNSNVGLNFHGGDSAANVQHCTIAYNGSDGANLDATSSCIFRNNIVAFNRDDGVVRGGSSHTYNLVYGNYDRNYDGTSAGTGSLALSPRFVSLSDLHLQSASPAINTGTGTMSIDLDGSLRPVGPKVDMGCYEYGSTGGSGTGGNDYFVRVTGSDSKSGTSPPNAFKTITKAISVVQPGDRVWVGAGTHVDVADISSKTGTAEDPITFNADISGLKTGDAGVVHLHGGFYVRNSAYIVINGFTIRPQTTKPTWASYISGIYLANSTRVSLENLQTFNGQYGVFGTASLNTTVSTCEFSGASVHGVCFQGTSSADVVTCTSSGNTLAGYYALDSTVNASDCVSSGNLSRGFHYSNSRGMILGSSSTNDNLAAELRGITNDRMSIVATGLEIQGSMQGALLLQDCTVDVPGTNAAICTGGSYAAHATNAKLTLNNVVISGRPTGVEAYSSSIVNLNNCQISSCTNHGIYLDASTGNLANCTISSCSRGVRGENNSTLNASNSTFNTNTNWAIVNTGYGAVTDCVINSNGQGVCLIGAQSRGDVTISGTKIQNTAREGFMGVRCVGNLIAGTQKLSKSGAYGIYLLDSDMVVTGVEIASTQFGVQSFGSSLELVGTTITGCSSDGLYMDNSWTTLKSSTINSCRQGVWSENASTLVADGCTFENHTSWGINHTGYGTVDNCEVRSCAKGVTLTGGSDRGDITFSSLVIRGTTGEGLAAIRCTGNLVAAPGKVSNGGAYGIYLADSELQADGIAISGSQYGIQVEDSILNLSNGSISGCVLDGVYSDQCNLSFANSSITGCRYGIRSEGSGVLTANQLTLANNRAWGVHHTGTGTLTNCTSDGNYQGAYLVGQTAIGDVTFADLKIQGTTREGLYAARCTGNVIAGNDKLSKGGDYGAYLSESDLAFGAVQISGSTYGIMAYSSTLEVSNASITDCSSDGIYANQTPTTLANCTIARCRNGVNSDSGATLIASGNTIDACTAWGVFHSGYATITNSSVNDCQQGMYLVGVSQNTDITLANVTIQGTAKEGLVAVRCSGEIVGGADYLSQGGPYGAYLSLSDVDLTGVAVTGSQRGIVALNSTTTISNGTITSTTQEGIYTEGSSITLADTQVSGCGTRGIDCQMDSTLTATNLVVQSCGDWGLALSGLGTITSCQLVNNQHGANLVGKATRGDIILTDLVISGTLGQGLAATRCTGTVQGGADALSKGGTFGINSNDSQLTVTNATIRGPAEGIRSSLSTLTIRGVTISNVGKGVYSDRDQNLLMESTRIENCSAWGLHQIQGNSQTTNCVLANTASGLFFDAATESKLWNTTIVATGSYGIYQNAGTLDVKNTIVAGNNTGTGIYRSGGSLAIANNLVYGFATNFSGVTPDANTVSKNPRFNNALGGDYKLAKGSPAINAGADLTGFVNVDFMGSTRPAFKQWDIGAYEFLQADGSLRVLEWSEKK